MKLSTKLLMDEVVLVIQHCPGEAQKMVVSAKLIISLSFCRAKIRGYLHRTAMLNIVMVIISDNNGESTG